MKKILLFLLLAWYSKSFAQYYFLDRTIFQIGISADYYDSPIRTYTFLFVEYGGKDKQNLNVPLFSNDYGFSLEFSMQYNIFEISDESSVSLDVPIRIGYSDQDDYNAHHIKGFGYIFLPLTINYNYGLGSTYSTRSDRGFNIGCGMNLAFTPVIYSTLDDLYAYDFVTDKTYRYYDYEKGQLDYKKLFITPVLKIGYSYWNKNNKAREIYALFNYGKKTDYENLSWNYDELHSSHRVMQVSLTFSYLLNY